ncbi:MAG: hypothetical protein RLY71_2986 [Pseudomonadota bacterium]|jgi:hypothetical protein
MSLTSVLRSLALAIWLGGPNLAPAQTQPPPSPEPTEPAGAEQAAALEQVRQRMATTLEPLLDRYPPALSGEPQRRQVLAAYRALQAELDARVAARPTDPAWLYLRGRLQRFGHNLDQPGTWRGATQDLRAVLTINPWHVPALLDLGTLWVHSTPKLAVSAEQMLRTAQCYHGSEPLEVAQRGVFFARYFRGDVQGAAQQLAYLRQHWPEQDEYRRLDDMVRQVLRRTDPASTSESSRLMPASCMP